MSAERCNGKYRVKPAMCLVKPHAMKKYEVVVVYLHLGTAW
jgi:hypothetical protein